MRYGIFSDVHGNLEALESVVAAFQGEGIDSYVCVGDIVGYNANPCECIAAVRELTSCVVAGNHDWASVELIPTTSFHPAAAEAIIWTKGLLGDKERSFLSSLAAVFTNKDLTLAHGTLQRPEQFDYMAGTDDASQTFEILTTRVCFVGHSHIPGVFTQGPRGAISYAQPGGIAIEKGMRYIINCGSVGQPRDWNPKAAYCVYDTFAGTVSIKRCAYDRAAARKKIMDAGLPPALGERLLIGR